MYKSIYIQNAPLDSGHQLHDGLRIENQEKPTWGRVHKWPLSHLAGEPKF